MRQKVILTLTRGEPHGLRDCIPLSTLPASAFFGLELTAHDADGTLLFDGVIDYAQSNTLPSRPSLDLTIDAKHLISCGSFRAMDLPVENAGTSSTQERSQPSFDALTIQQQMKRAASLLKNGASRSLYFPMCKCTRNPNNCEVSFCEFPRCGYE